MFTLKKKFCLITVNLICFSVMKHCISNIRKASYDPYSPQAEFRVRIV